MKKLLAILVTSVAVTTASASGHEKAFAPTPPTMEIEILDPNRDPSGNPKAITVLQPNGLKTVEIPPTLLVHKLYFTGERNFQGPYIPGGPCVIVANHPRTGERVYVPVQMHPGFPRVKYTGKTIEYDYGPQSITIEFAHCQPKVIYSQQDKLSVSMGRKLEAMGSGLRTLGEHSELSTAFGKAKQGTKNLLVNATDKTAAVAKAVASPFAKVLGNVPGAKLFTDSTSADAALKEAQLRGREFQDKVKEVPFLPTNR